jgi:iron complex outermembrane receptor protein
MSSDRRPGARGRRARRSAACLAAALAACSGRALAEAPAAPPAAADPSEEAILFAEIPSVSPASKFEQSVLEAPASVTVISAEEIARYGHRTLADVLRSVRGFHTVYDRNYTYVGVRGFGRPGDYNTRVLLLVDGHRVNENIFDGAYVGTESLVDVGDIERVEIVRGPSSSLYGTNAFFAVINVLTKRGRDLKVADLGGQTASFGTRAGRLSWGDRLGSGLEVAGSASVYDSAGQDVHYPKFDDPATNEGWAETDDGDRRAHGFARLSWRSLDVEAGYNRRSKEIPTGSFGTLFDDERARTHDRQGILSVSYRGDLPDGSRQDVLVGYNAYAYRGWYPYAYGLSRDYGSGRWWIVESQHVRAAGGRQRIVLGGQVTLNSDQDQGAVDPGPAGYRFGEHEISRHRAVYVQDEVRMGAGWILNAGLRHDVYDSFGGTTNPRVTLIHAPDGRSAAKLLFGRAFRAPNLYEMRFDDGAYLKGNLELEPERITTYEAAYERLLPHGLRIAGSAYHYDIERLITQTLDPADGRLQFRSIESVEAEGAEVGLDTDLGRAVMARMSYAHQRAADARTGEILTNSPRHLGKLNLSGTLGTEKLLAGLEALFTGSRRTLGSGRAPSSTV